MGGYDYYTEYATPMHSAHWIVKPGDVTKAWLNVIFSSIGYVLFGIIVYASYKKDVIWKHIHGVFLILIFAFVTDFVELRMHLLMITDHQNKGFSYGDDWSSSGELYSPTTLMACSIAIYLTFLHFLLSYVEAVVSIHRFVVHFCGRNLPAKLIYITLGAIFGLKIILTIAMFINGETRTSFDVCTKLYTMTALVMINIYVWFVVLAIAPVLSLLTLIKGHARKQDDSGVSAFILSSSSAMALMIGSYLLRELSERNSTWYNNFSIVSGIGNLIQDFRFLLLCLLAILIVSDIRDAVIATISGALGRPVNDEKSPSTIMNEAFLEESLDVEKAQKKTANHHECLLL